MKCVLHIGTEKTGSTSIQKFLYNNFSEFDKNKIYISRSLLQTPNNRRIVLAFQSRLDDWTRRNNIHSLEEKNEFFSDFPENFSLEIQNIRKNYDYYLISSEHFHSRLTKQKDINKLASFLKTQFDTITVIGYFREQTELVTSLYSTALKIDSSVSLESFAKLASPENYYYNYLNIADQWSFAFGKNNCFWRIFSKEQLLKQDVVEDFLSLLPIRNKITNENVEKYNNSLNYLQSIAFKKINELVPYWEQQENKNVNLNMLLKKEIKNIDFGINNKMILENKSEIFKKFETSNDEFFRKYFNTSNQFKIEEYKEINQHLDQKQIASLVEQIVERIVTTMLKK